MKIGLIGLGAIGSYLAKQFPKEIMWAYDIDMKKAEDKKKAIGGQFEIIGKINEGEFGKVDLVVEAASQQAVPLLIGALACCDVMIMSVGALADEKLLELLKKAAEENSTCVYIPSGAIAGLDGLKALKEIESVELTSSKPPAGFGREDNEKTVLFEGNAREACVKFPKNVNVSATLSLAGIGFERTKVKIVSDPELKTNTHRIVVKSKEADLDILVSNMPFPENPKTSYLAALSAARVLREMDKAIKIV
ncbi:aspartate dehydrogenase [Candidatus Micrarchaeota archaeon CG08_land_8_20_14_0_20_49_17]|nr:MAG: aspartate dehydrogenase [Candidatus Micrarchaeota archaeon CG08_land_8_20_14_0_20_49_17]PIZ98788.1 MAG: aspartate dehydrogenase [Candidatus Micrarchaeota archaeon CG_4_10_14_0_2_um_filter_49_7]HII53284.1 aspartate dehydrogenase [Candidatus Micrarchaeota archaeon]